jgi:hypothetical protein
MKRVTGVLFSLFVVLTFVFTACKKNNPAAAEVNTPDLTKTAVAAWTATLTQTNVAVSTLTATATITKTATDVIADTKTVTPTITETATDVVADTATMTVTETATAEDTATSTATTTPVVVVCTQIFGNIDDNYNLNLWNNYMIGSPFTAGSTGVINAVKLRNNISNVIVGIYSDNSGAPGSLLAETAATSVSINPSTIALISPLNVTSGTTYWIISVGESSGAIISAGATGTTLYSAEAWANVSSGMPSSLSGVSWSTWGTTSAELAAYNCN